MCGINGIVYFDRERAVSEALLNGMRDTMIHRGPDDCGTFIDGNIGLAHRRLSIIDVAGGKQPMTNEDGTIWIVFNGEIYNFKALRQGLLERGHVFRTQSDTEVVVHLFEEKGPECANELNGIFAFAIYDKRTHSLVLSRDHMGIKPLYYALTDKAFLFSSEIKSILSTGKIIKQCNSQALSEYFLFRSVAGENTLFTGIKNLLPAHTMVLKENKITDKGYWSPLANTSETKDDFRTASEKLSWLISDSIRGQLISDVPLGTFCSGGLDSSLVTAVAAGIKGEAINTFSVGFNETDFDETHYARLVAKQFKTNHHEVRLSNEEFADLLPKLAWYNDDPLNFANSVQIYAISKIAKEYVTVVLTGEGADELFGGYPRYSIPTLVSAYQKLPAFLRQILSTERFLKMDHRLEKVIHYAQYPHLRQLILNASFMKEEVLAELLLKPDFENLAYRTECVNAAKEKNLDTINQLSFLDQKTYLVSILMRQDKMSMAASIESRVPLLDYRIVKFANQLPSRYKMRKFKTKMIMKDVARKFLPDEIIDRRKSGFGVPLRRWFQESKGLGNVITDMVADIKTDDWVNKQCLENLVSAHKKNEHDYSETLWAFVSFMAWKRAFSMSL
jgi:asparagine synthase (glutamine-hydrolysing)